ncbi:hypothetical protein L3Q82_008694, partial [Scortum barcoo]
WALETQLLERGWTLHYYGVSQGERQGWCGLTYSSPAQPPCVGVHPGEREGHFPAPSGVFNTHCTCPQDTLGQRSMIDFVVLASNLRPYVLDTRVKRGAELSTDHHLVVSWIRWRRRKLDRPGRPKRIVRVCWECLAEPHHRPHQSHDTPSTEEVVSMEAEVTEVVCKLLCGKAPGWIRSTLSTSSLWMLWGCLG